MNEIHGLESLDLFAKSVKNGQEPQITGRQLLNLFGASRRGSRVVAYIRSELHKRNLFTEPDFNEVWVDIPLRLKALQVPPTSEGRVLPTPSQASDAGLIAAADAQASRGSRQMPEQENLDPVHRIGRLPAANQPVVSVAPGTPLNEAVTKMMLNEFSQLPVIQGRDCRGAVSWKSIATANAFGRTPQTVNECLDHCEEVLWNTGLLEAIPKIVSAGFVLVRGQDRSFQGIVTVADLSLQFRDLSEPFLLLGQIENLLRILIEKYFALEEIRQARNPNDTARTIDGVSDLTFGEYVRLLEPADVWPRLEISFARGPILEELRAIQVIRNDVMHFDPEPLESNDLSLLRRFAVFLERIVRR